MSYEIVTNLGATAGVKRKRAEAIGDDDEDDLQDKKNAAQGDTDQD